MLQSDRFKSIMLGLMGLALMSGSLGSILQGEFSYRNWRGAEVLAPAALMLGVVVVFLSFFGWKRLTAKLKGFTDKRKNW